MDPKSRIELFDLWFKIGSALFAAGWAVVLLYLIHRPLARAGLLKTKLEVEKLERKRNREEQKKSLQSGLSIDI